MFLTRQFDDFEPVLRLLVADPSVRLILRVDHQRPSSSAHDQDGVFRRKAVARKTVIVPSANFNGISANADQSAVVTHGNFQFDASLDPVLMECENDEFKSRFLAWNAKERRRCILTVVS